jgi:hypothetical protein
MAPEVSRSLDRLRQVLEVVDVLYKRNGEPYIRTVEEGVGLVRLLDDINEELGELDAAIRG